MLITDEPEDDVPSVFITDDTITDPLALSTNLIATVRSHVAVGTTQSADALAHRPPRRAVRVFEQPLKVPAPDAPGVHHMTTRTSFLVCVCVFVRSACVYGSWQERSTQHYVAGYLRRLPPPVTPAGDHNSCAICSTLS
jgi:hypothetical protein